MEKWKAIEGYDKMYDVSTHGQVRSWHKGKWGRRKEPRMLKPALSKGYPLVCLCKNGRSKTFLVHALVLLAFVGPCPPGLECCHGDDISVNNHLANLRWDTKSANMRDAIKHGLWVPNHIRGEAHGQAKLTEKNVIEIRHLYAGGGITYQELGARFGVSAVNIGLIINRATWVHIS